MRLWVKSYTRLITDSGYMSLTAGSKSLFHDCNLWCGLNESDGIIPASDVKALKGTPSKIAGLIDAGFWEEIETESGEVGYQVVGWVDGQGSSGDQKEKRKSGARRVARHRAKSASTRDQVETNSAPSDDQVETNSAPSDDQVETNSAPSDDQVETNSASVGRHLNGQNRPDQRKPSDVTLLEEKRVNQMIVEGEERQVISRARAREGWPPPPKEKAKEKAKDEETRNPSAPHPKGNQKNEDGGTSSASASGSAPAPDQASDQPSADPFREGPVVDVSGNAPDRPVTASGSSPGSKVDLSPETLQRRFEALERTNPRYLEVQKIKEKGPEFTPEERARIRRELIKYQTGEKPMPESVPATTEETSPPLSGSGDYDPIEEIIGKPLDKMDAGELVKYINTFYEHSEGDRPVGNPDTQREHLEWALSTYGSAKMAKMFRHIYLTHAGRVTVGWKGDKERIVPGHFRKEMSWFHEYLDEQIANANEVKNDSYTDENGTLHFDGFQFATTLAGRGLRRT